MPSRRDIIRMTDEELEAFLNGRHTMNVATYNHDGTIHLVAMWYGFVDGDPAFWTYKTSQKIRNIERDPRITCLIEDGDTYETLRGAELVGRAELITDWDQLLPLGRSVVGRYNDVEPSPEVDEYLKNYGAKRYGVRIKVDKVVSWDHTKLAGSY
ncbi:MAG: TIGR03618 family F420-dependent PPOX class oxidoreductase [Acidimicrobiales bacterium]